MGPMLWHAVRLVTAVVTALAIVVQSSAVANGVDEWDPSHFYANFTVQSSLIGIVVLVWAFRRRNSAPTRRLDLFRGAAAAYLVFTFFVAILFLSDVDEGLRLPWVEVMLHKVLPVIIVIDWILDPPRTGLRYTDALRWLAYPVVWLALTLVRGAADGWYPYSFLDPASGGYGTVAVSVVAIVIGLLAISAVLIWLGNWRSASTPGPEAQHLEEPRPPVPAEPPGWEQR